MIEGPAVLAPPLIPDLVDARGWFPSDQLRLGCNYFFRPRVRRQLRAEIRAQFEAFAATGLRLDHANAHKHMHLHPTIGRLLVTIGREFGLRAVRIPFEPPSVLAACGTPPGIGARALGSLDRPPAPAGEGGRPARQRPVLRHRLDRQYDHQHSAIVSRQTFRTVSAKSTSIRPPNPTRCWQH